MVSYYEMKRRLAVDVQEFLETTARAIETETVPPELQDFERRMLLKYGFGTATIRKTFEQFGVGVENDKIVRV